MLSSAGIKLIETVYLARGSLLLSIETNEAKIQGLRLGRLEEHRPFIPHHLRWQNRLYAEKKRKGNVKLLTLFYTPCS
jgi:hypothetical protein